MRTPASVIVEHTLCKSNEVKEGPTLQEAFASFLGSRQKKSRARTAWEASETRPQTRPASTSILAQEEKRARVRALFVETARGFIGVPYARKYHNRHYCNCEGCSASGRQLYHSPLFLDCCGLVRRVAWALQRQLGFRLGPGNQAYQYDTLPKRVESVEQLKPGDLIFYSGTYYEPGSRRHAFDMTHVEIFVGGSSGEATIGSRERYKWVMQYDNYRFESQRWKILACHFCSIDTWLDGLCHPKHPELWRPRRRTKQQQQQHGSTSSEGAWATVRLTRGTRGTGRNT
ncbi:hypothetical protein VaNZ11_004371, partial [Volvox africanus]